MPINPPQRCEHHGFNQELQSTSLSSAPMARRRPISLVRSVTLTSDDVHDADAAHQ